MSYEHGKDAKRMPKWLTRPIASPGRSGEVRRVIEDLGLYTVCQSAKCPNQGECFGQGTATFMIMGEECTRACTFCAVRSSAPGPLDPEEPGKVAEAAARMGLRHVVVTCVTRDDLPDGGAGHFVRTIEALRASVPDAAIEVLTSDFSGDMGSVDTVVDAGPDVFNHNLETIPRLYSQVRPQADYERSLTVLARAGQRGQGMPTKSGLMLGLGETSSEVVEVMEDLREVGCDLLTLGQYLRPSREHLEVSEFVDPEVFASLESEGLKLGFTAVASSPYVRSSYHAGELVSGG